MTELPDGLVAALADPYHLVNSAAGGMAVVFLADDLRTAVVTAELIQPDPLGARIACWKLPIAGTVRKQRGPWRGEQ